MNTKVLFELPIGNAGCGHIRFVSDGVMLAVHYEFTSEQRQQFGGLLFDDVNAFRFADEQHGAGTPDTYDDVVEVVDSLWLQSMIESEPERILGSVKQKHHFATFLSNNGYLEVIASEVSQIDPIECEFSTEWMTS